jgi:hypothetical protein
MNVAEKWNNYKTWKKAKIEEFNEKHPKLSKAIINTQMIIGVGLAFGVTYAAGYSDGKHSQGLDQYFAQAEKETKKAFPGWPGVEPVKDSSIETKSDDPWTRGWKEDYRENYNKVCDFANTLDLVKGEEFVISDTKQFENESWFKGDATKPVVSHLIDGDGCYPPEED